MLRMPAHPVAVDLLRETGPMAVSSANVSGHPPATTAQEAVDQLGEDVAVYLDGGDGTVGTASTIIDVSRTGRGCSARGPCRPGASPRCSG